MTTYDEGIMTMAAESGKDYNTDAGPCGAVVNRYPRSGRTRTKLRVVRHASRVATRKATQRNATRRIKTPPLRGIARLIVTATKYNVCTYGREMRKTAESYKRLTVKRIKIICNTIACFKIQVPNFGSVFLRSKQHQFFV